MSYGKHSSPSRSTPGNPPSSCSSSSMPTYSFFTTPSRHATTTAASMLSPLARLLAASSVDDEDASDLQPSLASLGIATPPPSSKPEEEGPDALDPVRLASTLKLLRQWEGTAAKYATRYLPGNEGFNEDDDEHDEIDLQTGKIYKDRGALRRMEASSFGEMLYAADEEDLLDDADEDEDSSLAPGQGRSSIKKEISDGESEDELNAWGPGTMLVQSAQLTPRAQQLLQNPSLHLQPSASPSTSALAGPSTPTPTKAQSDRARAKAIKAERQAVRERKAAERRAAWGPEMDDDLRSFLRAEEERRGKDDGRGGSEDGSGSGSESGSDEGSGSDCGSGEEDGGRNGVGLEDDGHRARMIEGRRGDSESEADEADLVNRVKPFRVSDAAAIPSHALQPDPVRVALNIGLPLQRSSPNHMSKPSLPATPTPRMEGPQITLHSARPYYIDLVGDGLSDDELDDLFERKPRAVDLPPKEEAGEVGFTAGIGAGPVDAMAVVPVTTGAVVPDSMMVAAIPLGWARSATGIIRRTVEDRACNPIALVQTEKAATSSAVCSPPTSSPVVTPLVITSGPTRPGTDVTPKRPYKRKLGPKESVPGSASRNSISITTGHPPQVEDAGITRRRKAALKDTASLLSATSPEQDTPATFSSSSSAGPADYSVTPISTPTAVVQPALPTAPLRPSPRVTVDFKTSPPPSSLLRSGDIPRRQRSRSSSVESIDPLALPSIPPRPARRTIHNSEMVDRKPVIRASSELSDVELVDPLSLTPSSRPKLASRSVLDVPVKQEKRSPAAVKVEQPGRSPRTQTQVTSRRRSTPTKATATLTSEPRRSLRPRVPRVDPFYVNLPPPSPSPPRRLPLPVANYERIEPPPTLALAPISCASSGSVASVLIPDIPHSTSVSASDIARPSPPSNAHLSMPTASREQIMLPPILALAPVSCASSGSLASALIPDMPRSAPVQALDVDMTVDREFDTLDRRLVLGPGTASASAMAMETFCRMVKVPERDHAVVAEIDRRILSGPIERKPVAEFSLPPPPPPGLSGLRGTKRSDPVTMAHASPSKRKRAVRDDGLRSSPGASHFAATPGSAIDGSSPVKRGRGRPRKLERPSLSGSPGQETLRNPTTSTPPKRPMRVNDFFFPTPLMAQADSARAIPGSPFGTSLLPVVASMHIPSSTSAGLGIAGQAINPTPILPTPVRHIPSPINSARFQPISEKKPPKPRRCRRCADAKREDLMWQCPGRSNTSRCKYGPGLPYTGIPHNGSIGVGSR